MNQKDLLNIHKGKSIFIVGTGPELYKIGKENICRLEKKISIGLNTTNYKFNSTYFLSSHYYEIMSAMKNSKTIALHAVDKAKADNVPGSTKLLLRKFNKNTGLPLVISNDKPILYSESNIALAAAHLACIMGAARIIYIGVELNNIAHFYHYDEELKKKILKDYNEIMTQELNNKYNMNNEAISLMNRKFTMSLKEAERTPFHSGYHTTFRTHYGLFERYSDIIRRKIGVRIYCTTKGILSEVGATVIPTDKALKM